MGFEDKCNKIYALVWVKDKGTPEYLNIEDKVVKVP